LIQVAFKTKQEPQHALQTCSVYCNIHGPPENKVLPAPPNFLSCICLADWISSSNCRSN